MTIITGWKAAMIWFIIAVTFIGSWELGKWLGRRIKHYQIDRQFEQAG